MPAFHSIKTVPPYIFIMACVGFFFLPTWLSLFELWKKLDFSYSYGFIALGLCGWGFLKRRTLFLNSTTQLNLLALVMLFGTSTLWFVSHTLNIQIISQLTLPVILYFAISALYGFNTSTKLMPAYLYLLFAIPVWDYLNPLLQNTTSFVASSILEFSGLAVYIEGNTISIPYGTFEVAGGCSGLRYLLASLVLVLFYSQQNDNNLSTTIKFFLVAIILGLMANWIRVTLIILIGYESEMKSPIVAEHDMFGWYVYIGALIPGFMVLNRLEKNGRKEEINAHHDTSTAKISISKLKPQLLLVTLMSLSIGPVLGGLHSLQITGNHANFAISTLAPSNEWQLLEVSSDVWQLQFNGSTTLPARSFIHKSNHIVTINSVYYTKEEQGHELVNSENKIANPAHWKIMPARKDLEIPQSVKTISNIIRQKGSPNKLIYSYYKVGPVNTPRSVTAKLNQLRTLVDSHTLQSYIAYGIDCKSDCIQESKLLSKFIDAFEFKHSIVKQGAS